MKKAHLLCLAGLLITALSSSACGRGTDDTTADLNTKQLNQYIKTITSEPYELVEVSNIYNDPDYKEYTLHSTKRDLTFHVYSYHELTDEKSKIRIKSKESTYLTDYYNLIRDIYKEDIFAEFDAYPASFNEGILAEDANQLESIQDSIIAANQLYQKETAYNSAKNLASNPFGFIKVYGKDNNDRYHEIHQYPIDGNQLDAEKLKAETAAIVSQMLADDQLSFETFGAYADQTGTIHKQKLNHIYLNGKEMLYDTKQSPYCYFALSTDSYCYAYYEAELGTYMMSMDYGFVADYGGSPPLIAAEYAKALGGEYKLLTPDQKTRDLDLASTWTIHGHTWELTAKHTEKKNLHDFKVTKDGEDLNLETYDGPTMFVAGLKVEDFCKLFDLTYEIDEKADSIYFTTVE